MTTSLFQNNVRVGVTKNVEVGAVMIGVPDEGIVFGGDLFLHTHTDSSMLNYGLLLGFFRSDDFDMAGLAVTTSMKLSEYFSPYSTLAIVNNLDPTIGSYIALGTEINIPLTRSRSVCLQFVPEGEYNLRGHVWGSITAGMTIDLPVLFSP